jgi:hypothetical protein
MDSCNQYVSVNTNENNDRELENNNDRRFFKRFRKFLKDNAILLILIVLCVIASITFYSVFSDSINKNFFFCRY